MTADPLQTPARFRFLLLIIISSAAIPAGPEPAGAAAQDVAIEPIVPLPEGVRLRLGDPREIGTASLRQVAVSSDGRLVATSDIRGGVILWRADTGKMLARHEPPGEAIFSLLFTPDDSTILAGGEGGAIHRWRVAGKDHPPPIGGHTAHVVSLALSPDGVTLASAGYDGTLLLHDLGDEDAEPRVLCPGARALHRAVFTPDGATLAVAGDDGSVRLFDAATLEAGRIIHAGDDPIYALAVDASGEILAGAGRDGKVRLWHLPSGAAREPLDAHEGWVNRLAFSPGGSALVSGGFDGQLLLWDAAEGRRISEERIGSVVTDITFTPDGRRFLVTSDSTAVGVRDAATGREARHAGDPTTGMGARAFRIGARPVTSATFDGDGRRLLLADGGPTIFVHDAREGTLLHEISARARVLDVAISPDGRTLAATTGHSLPYVWDLSGDEPRRIDDWPAWRKVPRLEAAMGAAESVVFGPEGATFFTRDRHGRLGGWTRGEEGVRNIWIDETSFRDRIGVPIRGAGRPPPRARRSGVSSRVAVSPSGGRVATFAAGGQVRVVDARHGIPLHTWLAREGPTTSVAFALGDAVLVTGGDDGMVAVWEPDTGSALLRFEAHGGPVTALEAAPDGRRIASADGKGTGKLWDVLTGLRVARLIGHEAPVNGAAFSPDGESLVTGADDTTALVWDLPPAPPPEPVLGKPDGPDPDGLWSALAEPPGPRVYETFAWLLSDPGAAVPILRDRLVEPLDDSEATFRALLLDLDDEDFATRERAHDRIARLRGRARDHIRSALEGGSTSPEVRTRLETLRGALDDPEDRYPSDRLRTRRAILLLGGVGTGAARPSLLEVSRSSPWEPDRALAAECVGAAREDADEPAPR